MFSVVVASALLLGPALSAAADTPDAGTSSTSATAAEEGTADPSRAPAVSGDSTTLRWVQESTSDGAATSAGYPSQGTPLPDAGWASCGLFDADTKKAKTYSRKKVYAAAVGGTLNGNVADLNCGRQSPNPYGLLHIQDEHADDWQGYSSYVSRNWRDMAGWAMSWALYDPYKVYWNKARNSWCYSRVVYLQQKQNGKWVEVARANTKVILGATGVRIVSAYPSTNGCTAADGARAL